MTNVRSNRVNLFGKLSIFRQKGKILILLIVAALLFLFYQFSFISVLDNSMLRSQELKVSETRSISRQDISFLGPDRAKVTDVFDRRGMIRGARLADLAKYKPDDNGMFTCFGTNIKIPFSYVNDDFCDCPEDGCDEPGTNACNNGHFYCKTQVRHKTGIGNVPVIPSSRVNDGICDCCDGSDEWNGVVLSDSLPIETQAKLGRYRAPCPNACSRL